MRPTTLTIALLALVASALAVPHGGSGSGGAAAPQPSHGPSCSYSCPDTDTANYSKHTPSCGEDNDTIICSYPQNHKRTGINRDFTCHYSKTTGKRVQDNDSGYCRDTAPQTCTNSPRYLHEDNFVAVKRIAEKRAANPQPVAIPEAMKNRKTLHKARHAGNY